MKRYKSTILKFSTADKEQLKDYCEDSIVDCPQIGERVLFVEGYNNPDLLEKPIIKLREAFFVDDGKEFVRVTKENYKQYNLSDIVTEKTDKYIEAIEPIEIINKK